MSNPHLETTHDGKRPDTETHVRLSKLLVPACLLVGLGAMATTPSLHAQDATKQKALTLPEALKILDDAIAQPSPGRMVDADAKAWAAETDWLKSARKRIADLGVENGIIEPREPTTGQASEKRQHNPIRFQKEYGRLATTLEEEGRQFNTLSNASKARHDLAMNAIRNLK